MVFGMVEVPRSQTKGFDSTFTVRIARLWNSLPAALFPEEYNLGIFKPQVNQFIPDKRVPPLVASSLKIKRVAAKCKPIIIFKKKQSPAWEVVVLTTRPFRLVISTFAESLTYAYAIFTWQVDWLVTL